MMTIDNVSRETAERFSIYLRLLNEWSRTVNLVSPKTLAEAETRHFADSAQLWAYRGNAASWADVGSGAGFPGLVIAMIAADEHPEMRVTLVESDRRKASFLATVSRETGARAIVLPARIEAIPALDCEIISARAFAPLDKIFALTQRHLALGARLILPKGRSAEAEIAHAQRAWHFDLTRHPSATDLGASILEISDLRHV